MILGSLMGPWEAGVAVLLLAAVVLAIVRGIPLAFRAGPVEFSTLQRVERKVTALAKEVKKTAALTEKTSAEIEGIGHAVNHQGPNVPTLVERVVGIEEHLRAVDSRLADGTDLHERILAELAALRRFIGAEES